MSLHPSIITAQNDEFRTSMLTQRQTSKIPGRLVITPGIAGLESPGQMSVIEKVRTFDAFTQDNDPYGEHDFGSIDQPGAGKIFWKIDYYNADLTDGSPDPADPKVTCRVLTIMLAQEY